MTKAAQQLYITQPAVSAALRRLQGAVGEPLFVRSGRGLSLSQRGQRLFDSAQPLLTNLIMAALEPEGFDPKTSERIVRLGLSDAMGGWLLPPLLRALEREAPRMRLIVVPVQFRTVADALQSRAVDLAVTVADELPTAIRREPLIHSGFLCLFDPKRVKPRARMSERDYFAHDHVIVSYNADMRGIVEDMLHKQRRVRCSVASFSHVGSVVEGSAMLATVPTVVARHLLRVHPRLRSAQLPFSLAGAPLELLWPIATDDDHASRFLREHIKRVVEAQNRT